MVHWNRNITTLRKLCQLCVCLVQTSPMYLRTGVTFKEYYRKCSPWSLQVSHHRQFTKPKHDGVMTWKYFLHYWSLYGNPLVTSGLVSHGASNANHLCVICCKPEQIVEYTVELTAIRDAMTFIWRHCNRMCALGSTETPKFSGPRVIGDRTHQGQMGSPWIVKVY